MNHDDERINRVWNSLWKFFRIVSIILIVIITIVALIEIS